MVLSGKWKNLWPRIPSRLSRGAEGWLFGGGFKKRPFHGLEHRFQLWKRKNASYSRQKYYKDLIYHDHVLWDNFFKMIAGRARRRPLKIIVQVAEISSSPFRDTPPALEDDEFGAGKIVAKHHCKEEKLWKR
jgi:hypothetical protein